MVVSQAAAEAAAKAIHKLAVQIRKQEQTLETGVPLVAGAPPGRLRGARHCPLPSPELVRGAQVVLATTAGAMDAVLDRGPAFDLVLLDEAGQSTEPGPGAWQTPALRYTSVSSMQHLEGLGS